MNIESTVGAPGKLALSLVGANPNNPRVMLDKVELASLTASLAAVGLIQPIIVRHKGEGYEIVAGHRRFAAAKALGWTEIPAVIRDVKDADLLSVATTENVQRADMHPLDEALACRKLTMEQGKTQASVATWLAKSPAWVAQRISLLGLSPKCRFAFKNGKFSLAVALVLARIPNHKLQDEVFENAQEGDGFVTESAASLADQVLRDTTGVLADAPFDSKDAQLVPKAGACMSCPKRTSACVTLFEDLQKKSDRCLDSQCWESKLSAHRVNVLKEAKQKGAKILEGQAAEHARYSDAYVKLDDTCYEHPKNWTWRRVLAGRPFEVILLVSEHSVKECVTKEVATAALLALLPAAKQKKVEKAALHAKEQKLKEQKQRKATIEKGLTDKAYSYEAARQASAHAIKNGMTVEFRTLMLNHLLGSLNHDGKRHACELFGLTASQSQFGKDFSAPLTKWKGSLAKDEIIGAVAALVVLRESAFSVEPLKKLLGSIGLDSNAIYKKALALRTQAKATKLKAKAKNQTKKA